MRALLEVRRRVPVRGVVAAADLPTAQAHPRCIQEPPIFEHSAQPATGVGRSVRSIMSRWEQEPVTCSRLDAGVGRCTRYRRGSAYAKPMNHVAAHDRPPTVAVAGEPTAGKTAVRRLGAFAPGLAAAGVVVGFGLADGGYFPTAWGPATLIFLAASASALALRATSNLGLRALVMPILLGVLSVWILVSSLWGSPTEAVPESQRALVYVSAALALALALRRGSTMGVLVGMWAGIAIVSMYALATRLFPEQIGAFDPIADYRLSAPIGYWNALGLFAALGVILAFGLVCRSKLLVVRLLAAASIVPLVLTLYFTFSRGAWIALAVGLLATLVLDPNRIRQAIVVGSIAPWPALAVLVASSSGPLTESGDHTLAAAAADGRDLTALTVGLMLAAAAAVALLAALEPRFHLAPRGQRVANGVVLAGIVALSAACVFALGGPSGIARSFAASPKASTDLNGRLFSLSGNGRAGQWRMALDLAAENPFVGSGAGSYQRYWLEHRPNAGAVRDAHSLYVETLAELGPFGLALVVGLFAFPLVLAVRSRRRPVRPDRGRSACCVPGSRRHRLGLGVSASYARRPRMCERDRRGSRGCHSPASSLASCRCAGDDRRACPSRCARCTRKSRRSRRNGRV